MSYLRVLPIVCILMFSMPAVVAQEIPAVSWEGTLDEGFVRSASDPLAVFFEVFPLGGDIEDVPAMGDIEVDANLVKLSLPADGGPVEGTIEFASTTRYSKITFSVNGSEGGFEWGPNTFNSAWSADLSGTYVPGTGGEAGTISGMASGLFTMTCAGVCPDLEESSSILESPFEAEVSLDSLIAVFADTAPASGFTGIRTPVLPLVVEEASIEPAAGEPADVAAGPVVATAPPTQSQVDAAAVSTEAPAVVDERPFPTKPAAAVGAAGLFMLLFWYWAKVMKGRANLGYADSVAVDNLFNELIAYPDPDPDPIEMRYGIGAPLDS